MSGFKGIAIENKNSIAGEPLLGFKGVSIEQLYVPLGGSIPTQQGTKGFAAQKFLRRLNSLLFTNLLPFVSNPRLDNLTVTLPDGRVFALGSNLEYGTISVPFCFFDEADEGSIEVTGTRRGTWPNAIEYSEPFTFTV